MQIEAGGTFVERSPRLPMIRLVLLAALALAACDRPDTPSPYVPAAGASPTFHGTEWRLETVDGAPPDSLQGGDALVTVTFTDQPFGDLDPDSWSLGGYDGCNDFGMAYTLDGDPASAEGASFRTGMVFSNAMACGSPGEHVSEVVNRGLGSARRVRLDGYRLSFADSLGAERVTFVPRPIRAVDTLAVVTGRWRLDPQASTVTNSYGGAPGRYEVAFASDSTYTGTAGCRTFDGRYRLTGDRLRVESYSLDDQACAPDDRMWDGPRGLSVGEVEADSARLTIYVRTGGRAVFRRP